MASQFKAIRHSKLLLLETLRVSLSQSLVAEENISLRGCLIRNWKARNKIITKKQIFFYVRYNFPCVHIYIYIYRERERGRNINDYKNE